MEVIRINKSKWIIREQLHSIVVQRIAGDVTCDFCDDKATFSITEKLETKFGCDRHVGTDFFEAIGEETNGPK